MPGLRTILVLGVAVASAAHAGQLHIQHYGLKEVREREVTTLIGTVVSGTSDGQRKHTVTLTVTRVFLGKDAGPPAAGTTVTRELYPGVEWTDPRRSPIETRLRDKLDAAPPEGTAIVVVPSPSGAFEIAAATPARLRALELLYAPDLSARLAAEPLDRLRVDLRDLDLAALARDELARRGALTPQLILAGDPQFAAEHFRALSPEDRATFVERALPHTQSSRALRVVATRIALDALRPPAVSATARLVAQLDVANADEARLFDDTRVGLMTLTEQVPTADLSPFADYLAASTIRRPDYREQDDWLPKLTARCDLPAKARLAARLLGAVYSSSRARGDDGDAFILATAAALAEEAPSEALWAPLVKIDPRKPRVTSTKEGVLAAAVRIGVALARHDPRFKDRVRDLIEPYLDERLRLPPELETLYRQQIGALPTKPAAPITLELRPGQTGRLPSSERVTYRIEGDSATVEIATPGGPSEERTIPLAEDGYREWWVPPYVVVVQRARAGVKLRFTPAAADPALEPADAYQMAKKICDARGAKELVDQDPRDYEGLYIYQATGATKPCTVRIGIRTRKVVP